MNRPAVLIGLIALAAVAAGATTENAMQPGTYAKFVTTEGNFTSRLHEQAAPNTVSKQAYRAEHARTNWATNRTAEIETTKATTLSAI